MRLNHKGGRALTLTLQTGVDWQQYFRHNLAQYLGEGDHQNHENRCISGNSARRAAAEAFATAVVGFFGAPLSSRVGLGWRLCAGALHQPTSPMEAVECCRPLLPYCSGSSL